jgi:hypothetical protein
MVDTNWKIFQDVPDDIDETWTKVALLGGMADLAIDYFFLATSFKTAGDILIEKGLANFDAYELIFPIMFNYRHSIELYLKSIVKSAKRNHDISTLFLELKNTLKTKHNTEIPSWFENWIDEFIKYDLKSTTFRYGDESINPVEIMVDLSKLREIMDIISQSFQRIAKVEGSKL